ncbi:tetratricopeptide repeat protein [bacterium]|nr:tetratricopeptide repeat protein [bacterium]
MTDQDQREWMGRRVGPYELLESLGQGGMGSIYRARHIVTGHLVALKMVRLPNEHHLQGIRREIFSLSRMSHPGIVHIEAHGLESGTPWYAMELLEGITLQSWSKGMGQDTVKGLAVETGHTRTYPAIDLNRIRETRSVTGVPGNTTGYQQNLYGPPDRDGLSGHETEAVPQRQYCLGSEHFGEILTVIHRLCNPLSYLHGEGLVHRDLKPNNILVRPDGSPVIIDFGLITMFGGDVSRESLVVEPWALGTPAYMAPEQLNNQLVDARTDIFALGCILYELLTGVHPFQAATRDEQIRRHLYEQPLPPSKYYPGLPIELERLIMHMLEKQPRQRTGFVEDVAVQLKKLGAGNGVFAAAPRARHYLYRADLAGRTEEQVHIRDNLVKVQCGQGRMLFILGESGIGKTRLAIQAGREAAEHDYLVLTGEAIEGSYAALGLFRKPLQSLADRCRTRGEAETRRIFGRCGAVLMDFEPAIRDLPGLEHYPEPAPLEREAAQLRIVTDLVEVFRNTAAQQPVMLILDDLQWADQLSLEFLHFVQKNLNLTGGHCLIVGLCRKEEVPPFLAEILASCPDRILSLDRLGPEHLTSIISDMLATATPPEELCRYLTSVAEGNPFFVAEYLRLAMSMGIFSRNSLGQWLLPHDQSSSALAQFEKLGLPGSLRALLEKRIQGLPIAVRQTAELCALIGKMAPVQLIWSVSGQNEEQILASLDDLLKHQIFEWDSPSTIRFTHDKLREIMVKHIPVRQKRDMHGRIVTGIEAISASAQSPEQYYPDLGFHNEMAGNNDKAVHYYVRAAQNALHHFSYEETIVHCERVGALSDSSEAKLLMAHALIGLARFEDADRIALDLMASENVTESEKTATLLVQAELRERHGQFEDSNVLVRQILAREPTGLPRIQALIIGSRNYIRLGEIEAAEPYLIEALTLAQVEGREKEQASILNNLGIVARGKGQLEHALELYDQSLAIRRKCQDRLGEAHLLVNISAIDYDRFRFQDSLEGQKKALVIYRELGHRYGVADCLSNIGAVLQIMGRNQEALQVQEESLAIVQEIGNQYGIADSLRRMATVQLKLGLFREARLALERTLEIARHINHPQLELETRHLLGRTYYAEGKSETALEIFNEVIDQGARIKHTLIQARALIDRAELLFIRARTILDLDVKLALTFLDQYPEDRIYALGLLARFEADQARTEAARAKLDQADRLAQKIGNPVTLLKFREDEAWVYARLGLAHEFERTVAEAEGLARQLEDTPALKRLKQLREYRMSP